MELLLNMMDFMFYTLFEIYDKNVQVLPSNVLEDDRAHYLYYFKNGILKEIYSSADIGAYEVYGSVYSKPNERVYSMDIYSNIGITDVGLVNDFDLNDI